MTTTSLESTSLYSDRIVAIRKLLNANHDCFGDEPWKVSANDPRIIPELYKAIMEIGQKIFADLNEAVWRLDYDFRAYSEAWMSLGNFMKELESTVNLIEGLITIDESPRNEDTDDRLKCALQLRYHTDLMYYIMAGHTLHLDEMDYERYLKEYGIWPERDSIFDSLDEGIGDYTEYFNRGLDCIDRTQVKTNLQEENPRFERTLRKLSGHVESMSDQLTVDAVPKGNKRQDPSSTSDRAHVAEPGPEQHGATSHQGLSAEEVRICHKLSTLSQLQILILLVTAEGPIGVKDLTSELKKHKYSRGPKTISNNLAKLRGEGLDENRNKNKWETASKIIDLLNAGHRLPRYIEIVQQKYREATYRSDLVDVLTSEV